MFETWKKRRELEKQVRELNQQLADAEKRRDHDDFQLIAYDIDSKKMWLESIETNGLVKRLIKRGIEPPRNRATWWKTAGSRLRFCDSRTSRPQRSLVYKSPDLYSMHNAECTMHNCGNSVPVPEGDIHGQKTLYFAATLCYACNGLDL